MKKPALLVIASTYPRWQGDTEPAFVHQLAARLADRFDVVVSTSRTFGAKKHEAIEGVQVYRYAYAPARLETLTYGGGTANNLRSKPWKLLLLPTFFVCWILQVALLRIRFRFDVVHAHWFVPGGLVAACAAQGVPYCVTAHGTDVFGLQGRFWSRLRQWIAVRASAVTAVGTRLRSHLRLEGIDGAMVLPMGVDLASVFTPRTQPSQPARLLFVGRLVKAKRVEVVLEAFRKVREVCPDVGLDIAGGGPEQARLEALADAMSIRDRVLFHGACTHPELAELYRSAAGVLIPSGNEEAPEGLCLVAIEALGCGCPVVSVPNAALQSLLPDDAPIRYARDGSADAMSAATVGMLDESAKVPPSANGKWREELVNRFDWNAVAARYSDLLISLIKPG